MPPFGQVSDAMNRASPVPVR